MDRVTRKDLKTDKFRVEVSHGVEYVSEHRNQVARYAAIAAAVLVVMMGIYLYRQHAHSVRQDELRNALRTQEAAIGQAPGDFVMAFPTQQEKDKAVSKAFNDVLSKYPNSDEGAIARYYLGTINADKGNLVEAEKNLKIVADSGPANYASLAKLALAPIYAGQGKLAQAESLLRSVIAKPTVMVSKEQATIALARMLAASKPQEARNLLEPLRTERQVISRAALNALSELPKK